MRGVTSGLRVALVDKHRFPRDKLCGGGITGRALTQYRDIFGGVLPDIPLERRDCISFHAFGAELGTVQDAPPLHLGMRRALDTALVAEAIGAGAVDCTGHAGALSLDAPGVRVGGKLLSAPLIIGADGVNSPTARVLFGQAFDRARVGFALEVERPGAAPEAPLRIDFGAANWGYGWQFPKPDGTTIGVGGVMARNPDMKAALRSYLDLLGISEELPVKGQFLPFGDFRAVPGRGRVLLAGDAAGLVDPITGEGIAHALKSGALAAEAATAALEAGDPDSALRRYGRALAPIHRGLRQAGLLRHIMFREHLRPAFIRSFRASRSLRGEYLRLLAGETEYGAIMQQMALRLPGFGWRALRGV
ncbi:geranylgeranyl reductase [Pseudoponticoccus marisrubri]|uniref:Geranylgeranyl reductase n=2 Tax=Pseudoponticoccus marisrubri TaxID=1685382 RepID=A0A0W7WJB7_9RHOB|nr:geranylgeranyl reductase [Pseudoponticoccus marisrubri]